MFNFNHLLIFHKVAEKRHFTRAAEELYISQPAVSKQMHELEKALGQPLFTYVGRKLYLTEAGKLLYHYTGQIFSLAREAEEALQDIGELKRGRLAIGASTTIGTYLLPTMLGHFRQRYPEIELFLDIANAEEIQQRVVAREVEIGIVEGAVHQPELAHTVWQQDELVLITAAHISTATLAITQEQTIHADMTLSELLAASVHFILREPGSGTREVFEHELHMRGITPPQPFMELGSTEAIKRAVIAGLGISFVSEHTIQLELAAGLLQRVALRDFRLIRPLFIIYPQQKRISRAAQEFLAIMGQEQPS